MGVSSSVATPTSPATVVFGAVLLVSKRGDKIQARQHLSQPVRIGHFDFQLFAVLVLAGGGRAFVSQNTQRASLADAQQAALASQCPARGIEERIRLEDPALGYAEPSGAQETAARIGIRQRQLDLDLARRLGTSYSFLPTIA